MRVLKPRNLLLVLVLCLAVALLALIALRYRPQGQLEAIVKALPKGIDVALQDIDYTHIEDGRARWRLVALQVERQAASKVVGLSGPQLSFFDEQGAVKGALQASKGEVSDDYQKVNLQGDVVLKSVAGYTLYTDHLDYDHTTQTASTDAHVRLVAEGVDLEGSGLIFYLKQERLLLNANVKGTLDSDKMK